MQPKYSYGEKVFAKVRGHPYWPGFIEAVGQKHLKGFRYKIYFYGTGQTAVLNEESICPFLENEARFGKLKRNKKFIKALEEIKYELKSQERRNLKREAMMDTCERITEEHLGDVEFKCRVDLTPGKSETLLSSEGKKKTVSFQNSVTNQ